MFLFALNEYTNVLEWTLKEYVKLCSLELLLSESQKSALGT